MVPNSPNITSTICGDGNRMFAGDHNPTRLYTATESLGTDWKSYPSPTSCQDRPVYFVYDTTLHLMYAAATTCGLWRVVTKASTTNVNPPQMSASAPAMMKITPMAITVSASPHSRWRLDLYALNGVKIAEFSGVGNRESRNPAAAGVKGFSVARLTSETDEIVRMMVKP
jgi:hypothetical protein